MKQIKTNVLKTIFTIFGCYIINHTTLTFTAVVSPGGTPPTSTPLDAGQDQSVDPKTQKTIDQRDKLASELHTDLSKLRDALHDLLKDISLKSLNEQSKVLGNWIKKIQQLATDADKKWFADRFEKIMNHDVFRFLLSARDYNIASEIIKDAEEKNVKKGPATTPTPPPFIHTELPENLQSIDDLFKPLEIADTLMAEVEKKQKADAKASEKAKKSKKAAPTTKK